MNDRVVQHARNPLTDNDNYLKQQKGLPQNETASLLWFAGRIVWCGVRAYDFERDSPSKPFWRGISCCSRTFFPAKVVSAGFLTVI